MKLQEISWPVYRLGRNKPLEYEEILFYSKEYFNKDTGETSISMRVIDDKSVLGDTLGLRRLKIDATLVPLRIAIYFLADLVKIAKAGIWFIDSSGKTFQYKKLTKSLLVCRKIQQILPGTGMGAVIEVEGKTNRFKCLYRPTPSQRYAGILQWGFADMLYGFYEEPFQDSWRKV